MNIFTIIPHVILNRKVALATAPGSGSLNLVQEMLKQVQHDIKGGGK